MTIRVVLVDDHEFILEMFPLYFDKFDDVELVATASSQSECLEMMETVNPDIFIVDFNLGEQTSVFLVRKIIEKLPNSRVLGYSGMEDVMVIKQMLYAGASGFVSKNVTSDIIYTAIKEVHSGRIYTSDDIAEKLLESSNDSSHAEKITNLSAKELEVLKGIANGYRKTDLAKKLHISPNTLQTYKTRIFSKLGLTTDVDLCLFAVKHKLIKI